MAAVASMAVFAGAQQHEGHNSILKIDTPKGPAALKALPDKLPGWMNSPRYNEYFYKRGRT